MANTNVAYPVLGVYLILILGAGFIGAVMNFRRGALGHQDQVREHFLAGKGLGGFVWFWTMMATLFSGYSVSGIVNEAYRQGWMVTKWIPGGVGLYIAFAVMAPRLHALSKRRGYFTISQVIYDRYLPPSGSHVLVAHALSLLSFACLQLPVFTYLITQFKSLGVEVSTFTGREISPTVAINVAAAVLLLCDLFGGMRAVAFTDVIQGVVLFFGSIIFLIIQQTELGGMPAAQDVWGYAKPTKATARFWYMQHVPNKVDIVSYFDFVFKTTVAATMFPHLTARLFAARSSKVIRHGMACMVFTFFVVQFSSMITGWVASAAIPSLAVGQSAFGKLLQVVARRGSGQAFAAAMLLASAICAMMSTADSALLAFSQMWVRDIYTRYLRPHAGQIEQLIFAKVVAIIGLAIGVTLGNYSAERNKPDLSGLFALQNVTPIHVTPAVWLGLHWRGLRAEAVLTGFVCGLGVTLGLVFSDRNIQRANGSDMTVVGISSAWFGFVVNIGITIILGVLMQHFPRLFGLQPLPPPPPPEQVEEVGEHEDGCEFASVGTSSGEMAKEGLEVPAAASGGRFGGGAAAMIAAAAARSPSVVFSRFVPRHLEIGVHRDRTLNPLLFTLMGLVLLFTVPFYRVPMSWDGYVGHIGSWAFTSLLLSGILAILGALTFLFVWEDYKPVKEAVLPPSYSLPPPMEDWTGVGQKVMACRYLVWMELLDGGL
ncbi:hypothetical protein VOLCADRAFT_104191 [Volvox carteri f. nagariensis]|uniref:Na+/solute symporter n=1 Tax=Volvox carteri f. nagariensis TaxID=3068 RepID=D8TS15_VOLCA|nr:uncharacterized protein VOLCADRAFT_104191 [Volvox carteri f. nagariensis]EFJ49747.1 hypothetical protein VOLCADRAFT_104191 [Volvox carteri f. nagariensis]|eukprot:XP_002949254.1 hypothetical protein VOLCADRAFT_104191 [Volvox carteri f. nagariensis]